MFRIIRIAAIVGAIAYLSPFRDGIAAGPGLQEIGARSIDRLGQMLTARWMGSGNLTEVLTPKAKQELALQGALRRTLDPTTTSSIEGMREDAPED